MHRLSGSSKFHASGHQIEGGSSVLRWLIRVGRIDFEGPQDASRSFRNGTLGIDSKSYDELCNIEKKNGFLKRPASQSISEFSSSSRTLCYAVLNGGFVWGKKRQMPITIDSTTLGATVLYNTSQQGQFLFVSPIGVNGNARNVRTKTPSGK